MYVVDAADRGGVIRKYSYAGGAWANAGQVDLEGGLGLAASVQGGQVKLLATTPDGIWSVTDSAPTAGNGAGLSGPTRVAGAPANTAFRGIALAPVGSDRLPQGPSIRITSPAEGATIPPSRKSLAVSAVVTDSDGVQSVSVAVDNKGPVKAKKGSRSTWSASVPLKGLKSGAHSLTVTAVDGSSSHLSRSANRSFKVDAGVLVLASKVKHTKGFKVAKNKSLVAKKKATATFTFRGRGVALNFGRSKRAGLVKVTVDRKSRTYNLFAKRAKTVTKSFTGLKSAKHTVVVKALGKKRGKSKGTTVAFVSYVVKP